MSMSSKHRTLIASVGIVILFLGVFLIAFGDTLPHVYPASTMLSPFKLMPFAVTCLGTDNTVMCGPDSEQFPTNSWQLRWGSVDQAAGGFRWREYWYSTYRFMQKWSQDYSGDTGSSPFSVRPYCDSGLDKNSDQSACNTGTPTMPGADNWFGYIATRTFRAGSVSGWSSGQGVHVHGEFTFDDAMRVQVNINGQGWQNIAQQYTPNTSGGPNSPLTWDKDLGASDVMLVRVIWAEFTGSALVNNSWDFGTVAPSCDLSEDIFSYSLIDQTHGTQANILIHDPNMKYDVDPTFTIKATSLQSGCSSIINKVPVSLWPNGYMRTPNYQMAKNSDGSWQIQVGPLSSGSYYLNIGVETSVGTQWGLSVMKLSFVSSTIVTVQSGITTDVLSYFTPIRIFGAMLGIIGIAVIGIVMVPRKRP